MAAGRGFVFAFQDVFQCPAHRHTAADPSERGGQQGLLKPLLDRLFGSPSSLAVHPALLARADTQAAFKLATAPSTGTGPHRLALLLKDRVAILDAAQLGGNEGSSAATLPRDCPVAPDPAPERRTLAWGPAGQLLAIGSSAGTVAIVSAQGSFLYDVAAPGTEAWEAAAAASAAPPEPGRALALLALLRALPASSAVLGRLLTVAYDGAVTLVQLNSRVAADKSTLLCSVPLGSHFRHVGAAAVAPPASGSGTGGLVLVSGQPVRPGGPSLRVWRIADEAPFLAPFESAASLEGVAPDDFCTRLAFDAAGRRVAALLLSGDLLLLDFPSLRTQKRFSETDCRSPGPMLDVVWWDADALLVCHAAGVLLWDSAKEESRLTGVDEVAVGRPSLSAGPRSTEEDGARVSFYLTTTDKPVGFDDSWRDPLDALWGLLGGLYRRLIGGTATAAEKRQILETAHHLIRCQSVTAQRHYLGLLQNREFDRAHAVAEQHGLDLNKVYVARWCSCPVTLATVEGALAKVSDEPWIVQQCSVTVPPDAACAAALMTLGERTAKSAGDADAARRFQAGHNYLHVFKELGAFDGEQFVHFQEQPLAQTVLELATLAKVPALLVLLNRFPELQDHYLAVLGAVPESFHPSRLQKLLPKVSRQGEVLLPFAAGASSAALSEADLELLYGASGPARPAGRALQASDLTDVFASRAAAYERCGLTDHAFAVVGQGVARGVPGLDGLLDDLKNVSSLVYEIRVPDMTLARYQHLPTRDRALAFLHGADHDTIFSRVQLYVHPFVRRLPDPAAHGPALLDVLLHVCRQFPALAVQVATASAPSLPDRECLLPTQRELCLFILGVVQAEPPAPQADARTEELLIEQIPPEGDLAALGLDAESEATLRRLTQLERARAMLDGVAMNVSVHRLLDLDGSAALVFLGQYARRRLTAPPAAEGDGDTGSAAVLEEIARLSVLLKEPLDERGVRVVHVSALLSTAREHHFEEAQRLCGHGGKGPRDDPELQAAVLAAAQEHVNAASSCADPGIRFAERCLADVVAPDEAIRAEAQFIQALRVLSPLTRSIIPLGLRLSEDKAASLRAAAGSSGDLDAWCTAAGLLGADPVPVLAGIALAAAKAGGEGAATRAAARLADPTTALSEDSIEDVMEVAGLREVEAGGRLRLFAKVMCCAEASQAQRAAALLGWRATHALRTLAETVVADVAGVRPDARSVGRLLDTRPVREPPTSKLGGSGAPKSCTLPFYRDVALDVGWAYCEGTPPRLSEETLAEVAADCLRIGAALQALEPQPENGCVVVAQPADSNAKDAVQAAHLRLAKRVAGLDGVLSLAHLLHVDPAHGLPELLEQCDAPSAGFLTMCLAALHYPAVLQKGLGTEPQGRKERLSACLPALRAVIGAELPVELQALEARLVQALQSLELVGQVRSYLGDVDEQRLGSDPAYCRGLVDQLCQTTSADALSVCELLSARAALPALYPYEGCAQWLMAHSREVGVAEVEAGLGMLGPHLGPLSNDGVAALIAEFGKAAADMKVDSLGLVADFLSSLPQADAESLDKVLVGLLQGAYLAEADKLTLCAVLSRVSEPGASQALEALTVSSAARGQSLARRRALVGACAVALPDQCSARVAAVQARLEMLGLDAVAQLAALRPGLAGELDEALMTGATARPLLLGVLVDHPSLEAAEQCAGVLAAAPDAGSEDTPEALLTASMGLVRAVLGALPPGVPVPYSSLFATPTPPEDALLQYLRLVKRGGPDLFAVFAAVFAGARQEPGAQQFPALALVLSELLPDDAQPPPADGEGTDDSSKAEASTDEPSAPAPTATEAFVAQTWGKAVSDSRMVEEQGLALPSLLEESAGDAEKLKRFVQLLGSLRARLDAPVFAANFVGAFGQLVRHDGVGARAALEACFEWSPQSAGREVYLDTGAEGEALDSLLAGAHGAEACLLALTSQHETLQLRARPLCADAEPDAVVSAVLANTSMPAPVRAMLLTPYLETHAAVRDLGPTLAAELQDLGLWADAAAFSLRAKRFHPGLLSFAALAAAALHATGS